MSGVRLYGEENCHNRCLQKINIERIFKDKEAYFVVVTMGRKIKTDKIWLYESVGKIKGIGKEGEVKMN